MQVILLSIFCDLYHLFFYMNFELPCYGKFLPLQFRPVVPTQQGQPYVPSVSPQFRPVGQGFPSNVGMPVSQSQQLQFSQPIQQLPSRPNQPGHTTPPSQAVQMSYVQTNRPHASVPMQSQQSGPPLTNHMPGLAGSGIPISSSYTVRSHQHFSMCFA